MLTWNREATQTFMEQFSIWAKLDMCCTSSDTSANIFFSCQAPIMETETIRVITEPLWWSAPVSHDLKGCRSLLDPRTRWGAWVQASSGSMLIWYVYVEGQFHLLARIKIHARVFGRHLVCHLMFDLSALIFNSGLHNPLSNQHHEEVTIGIWQIN